MNTRLIYECKNCGDRYLNPHLASYLGGDPRYSQCPFCGRYIEYSPPKRIKQVWISEGFTGRWIFKKEIGHWKDAE